jgi:hypothetical protein
MLHNYIRGRHNNFPGLSPSNMYQLHIIKLMKGRGKIVYSKHEEEWKATLKFI